MPPPTPDRTARRWHRRQRLDAYQARIDAQVRRFMAMAADWAVNLQEIHQVDGVILGGSEEAVVAFQSLLPGLLQADVITAAPIPVDAADSLIRAATAETIAAGRRQRDEIAVETLLDTAHAHGRAVVGIDPVLRALEAGQAHEVLIDPAWAQTVKRCAICGHVDDSAAGVTCARRRRSRHAAPARPGH
ncbi:MAG: hypothetical protein R2854_15065 [Caldilineaceae bacterium]